VSRQFNNHKGKYRSSAIGILTLSFLVLALFVYNSTRTPGAALTSHNYMNRPVGSYWVNDHWGGNGGVTCCWDLSGDHAKIVWILSLSKSQEEQGMTIERQEALLPMPERKAGDDTLHVYFLPENSIELVWSSTTLDTKHAPNEAASSQVKDEKGSSSKRLPTEQYPTSGRNLAV